MLTYNVDDSEQEQIHNVALGEGSRPLSIFRDQYSEELAYPGIFLGQKRPTSYPSSFLYAKTRRKDPGWSWSRESPNSGDKSKCHLGRGGKGACVSCLKVLRFKNS